MSGKEKGRSFISGVVVLTSATVAVKVLGLGFKIPMMNILGAEGMGYFNSAYEIFAMLCAVCTAGLPVALSVMISSYRQGGELGTVSRIYRLGVSVFTVLGLITSAALFFLAKPISEYIENPDAYFAMQAISPALLFVCLSSAVRGYFQGLGDMRPTALSQLIEALCKLVLGVIFASLSLKKGQSIAVAAAYAVLGMSVGMLFSALWLFAVRKKRRDEICRNEKYPTCEITSKSLMGYLFRLAVPITLGSVLLAAVRVVDMTLILKRLCDIGYSSAGANGVYGAYTAMAIPIFSLLPSLITPIALSLIPELAASAKRGDKEGEVYVVRSSMRLTTLFALPASVGLAVWAREVLELLFPKQSEAIDITAPLLSLLGISVLFSCVITTTNAILQAYSKPAMPIISMACGAVLKSVLAYFLIGHPSVGIWGAPISTLACDILICVINLYYINKYVPSLDGVGKLYGRPFAASIAMICTSLAVYMPIVYFGADKRLAFLAAIAAAVISYFFFAALFGAIDKEDMGSLPFFEKIINRSKKEKKE